MKRAQMDKLIQSLGQHRSEINVEGVDLHNPREETCFAIDRISVEVAAGVSMEFGADAQIFEVLHVRFLDDESDEFEYTGELPEPFERDMSQLKVRNMFGVPHETQGPIRMPQPLGLMGGRDVYFMNSDLYPGVKVVFKYLESLEVYGLAFKCAQRGA